MEKKMEGQAEETLLPQLQLLLEDFTARRKTMDDLAILPRENDKQIIKCCCDLKPNSWTKITKAATPQGDCRCI